MLFLPFLFLLTTSNPPLLPAPTCLALSSLNGVGGMSPVMSVIVACSGGWGRGVGEMLSLFPSMQTPGRVPQVRQGIVLLAPVTPGRGEDFLENVARTVWRRRDVGSRTARKLQKEGHGCVRGAASPSGARTEAQEGN